MSTDVRDQLRQIRTFPSLVRFLRDELDWPVETDDFEELTFDYEPEELGIDEANAAKIDEIKRMRPLVANQPWGIFFVKFEPRQLPVVALRRILAGVVVRKRATASAAEQPKWAEDDLLFISNYGEGNERKISFAHFSKDPTKSDLPTLKVIAWDELDTPLHLEHTADVLVERLSWPASEDEWDDETWRERWSSAFELRHREVISTSKALAERLAELARRIRAEILRVLEIETQDGKVTRLMKAFQEALVHDLDADGFADMYAQTITYGLLSARITDPHKKTADDFAAQMRTNPFLKELMETFLHAGGRLGKAGGPGIDFDELGVSEVVGLLDDAKMEAVVRDFGDKNPQEDPVIHFYELFLREYDAKKRMQRGVFYTPRPVVSYIVRFVHELLQTEFGLARGLADTATWGEMAERHDGLTIPEGAKPTDRFVTILDPATGTGTFLVEVIEVVHGTLVEEWKTAGYGSKEILDLWNAYVPEHLLPRLHGYELMMAPYAIAHLKVGLKLHETGYRFGSDERARIYLTNALEPAHDFSGQLDFAIPALAHEAAAVNDVKNDSHFTVVVGNPPYSIVSANAGRWISELSEVYKRTVRTRERQIQALSDDYVKFVRLGHWLLDSSRAGILGLITNNGYLDGHLFVDMRAALRFTFPTIRLLNLHGNLRTRERTPDGEKDDNVFDIQTGVAISCLSLHPVAESNRRIEYADLWGSRDDKYSALLKPPETIAPWAELELHASSDAWIPVSGDARDEWEAMVSLLDIFGTGDRRLDAQKRYAAGFVSQQDDFAIAFSDSDIRGRVGMLIDPAMTEGELRREFRLCTTSQWNFARAREELSGADLDHLMVKCTYRPFDIRWTVFHRGVVTILRKELMRHLVSGSNLALLATRGISRQTFAHVFVTDRLVDRHALDNASESMFVFPLFVYPEATVDASDAGLWGARHRIPNIASGFLTQLEGRVGADEKLVDDAFYCVYAILHSPAYRERYAEFLHGDFPRLPLPGSRRAFKRLARLGHALVSLHIMELPKLDRPIPTYIGPANPEVRRIGWSNETVWLDAAVPKRGQAAAPGSIGFQGVPEEVWNFHIGGYQVCEKWLKDRKGRTLSESDIAHYQKIVAALSETIRLMAEIDEVIETHGGWPAAFVAPTGEAAA